jgi:2'-5' RNA ligase
MSTLRLFVAIDMPDAAKDALAVLAEELERQAEGGRFVPRENFHLTMAFIGETGRVNDAHAAVQRVNRLHLDEPFVLRLQGIGSFPGGKAARRGGAERSRARRSDAVGRGGTAERGGVRRAAAAERGHTWWVGVADEPGPVGELGPVEDPGPLKGPRPAEAPALVAPARLAQLAGALSDELRTAGFALERRSFKPHVTLGRGVTAVRPVRLAVPECAFEVSCLTLMKSDLSTGRPAYSAL